jgi:molybdopterin/thiamine biosynthesis adenylyltransferase
MFMNILYADIVDRNSSTITKDEQEQLRNTTIASVGLGGMSLVSILAARTGVENFIVLDRDIYSPTNLNRQMACNIANLDKPKSLATKEVLLSINPNANVKDYLFDIQDVEKTKEVIADADYIFIGIDDAVARAIAGRAAKELNKPTILFGPVGLKGFIQTFVPGGMGYEEATYQPSLNKEFNDESVKKDLYLHQENFYICSKAFTLDYALDYLKGDEIIRNVGFSVNLLCCWAVAEFVKHVTGKGITFVAPRALTFDTMTGGPWNLQEVAENGKRLGIIRKTEGVEKAIEFVKELYKDQ